MKRIIGEYQGLYGVFFKKEAQIRVNYFENTIIDKEGVIRWESNHQVPPNELLDLWNYVGKEFNYEKSLNVSRIETSRTINEYIEAQKNKKYFHEEIAEMRAAFGAGTKVVDVITGKFVTV